MNGKRSFSQMPKFLEEEFAAWLSAELRKHYRPSRFHDRGGEYMAAAMARHMLHIEKLGWTGLSSHDEITGRGVVIHADGTVMLGSLIERNRTTGNLSHLLG